MIQVTPIRNQGSGVEFSSASMLLNNAPGSVAAVAGGQSRVLMTQAQSTPSARDSAQVDAPGVLPSRADPAARGPLPQTACKRMNCVVASADAPMPSLASPTSFISPSPP